MTSETTGDTSFLQPTASWIVVYAQCILIVTINVLTIIVFASSRHLRKPTTYLIINLAETDLLVGAVAVPLEIYFVPVKGFGWKDFIVSTFYNIFPVSSLTNLPLIALERLHAAPYPFRHCLIEKWAYYTITIGSWLLALLLASVMAVLNYYEPAVNRYAWTLYIVLTLLILAVSYVVVIINVKSNPPPQALGLVASDRNCQ